MDICDVPECYYCKVQTGGEESTMSLSRCQTPQLSESGSATPSKESGTSESKGKTKTAKNLKKVQRALKTLGVNFLHFDDQTAQNDMNENGDKANSGNSCDKEYCRMGCICDSITGKYTLSKLYYFFVKIKVIIEFNHRYC